MNMSAAIKKIKAAIHKRKVLELIYKTDKRDLMYFAVAPVCINEHDGKLYLLSLDKNENAYAFEIARITAIDEYWATFSLSGEFSINFFKDCLFKQGNHINGYIMILSELKSDLNPEELRKELQAIEADIKAIVGPRKEDDWVDIPAGIDRENLKSLLRSRRYCLNMLFRKDPKGL